MSKLTKKRWLEVGAIGITNRLSVLGRNFGYALHSTEGLFVMPIAPTSHHPFLSILVFLEYLYMILIDKKKF